MKPLFSILLILYSFSTFGQGRNSIWCFGDSAGIDFSNPNNPVPISTSLRTRGSCASIADSLGNLLFYCQTNESLGSCLATQIFTMSNQLMDNGDSIIGEGWYKELLIVPFPGEPDKFIVISLSEIGCTLGLEGLYYSIVDISINGGLGKVIQKNIQLLSFQVNDGIAAVRHGNGRDWWILARQWDYQTTTHDYEEFHTFLITADSILGPFTQQIGSMSNNGFYRIEPSNDGLNIICTEPTGIIELFDFDRCTGLLSNTITIEPRRAMLAYHPNYWSCELSIDKSKLYVTSLLVGPNQDSTYLFQYDLNAPNITASRDTLIGLKEPPFDGGSVELGPDGKIYYTMKYRSPSGISYPYPDSMYNYINQNLGVINYPDSLCPACDFQPFSFYLGGKRTYLGLPNNPNYDLPAWGGSICDTLGLWNSTTSHSEKPGRLSVFYHPGWQTTFVNASGMKGRNYSLHLMDLSGMEIYSEHGRLSDQYFTKDLRCESLSSGLYFLLFETEQDKLVQKFVVE